MKILLIMKITILMIFGTVIQSTYGGQDCISCSNVGTVSECQNYITCDVNEVLKTYIRVQNTPKKIQKWTQDKKCKVCYKHEYKTVSNTSMYDLGCSLPQFCRHSISGIFGRRADGHHIICESCCNNTRLCNRDLQCIVSATTGNNLSRECADIQNQYTDGVYNIYPDGTPIAVPVFCDMTTENKKWTVIQRRYNGSVEFYRNWQSYKEGFGYPNGEYWIGNDVIHEITAHENHELLIIMTDFDGVRKYAKYTSFSVGDEKSGYRLHASGYSGDAGDSLINHSGKMFSTFDKDNDLYSGNCATTDKGAWWYSACHTSNLNGNYLSGHTTKYGDGVIWGPWRGYQYSLKTVTMMIRPHNV